MAMSKGRIALGILSVAGVIGGMVLDNKESEQARKEQKQAAYDASCKITKEWYAQKGNPNARRKPKS